MYAYTSYFECNHDVNARKAEKKIIKGRGEGTWTSNPHRIRYTCTLNSCLRAVSYKLVYKNLERSEEIYMVTTSSQEFNDM